MTPTEYEFLSSSIGEVKQGLASVRGDVQGNAISQGNALAALSQKINDIQDRLFLDSTSAIPRLTDQLNRLDKRFTAEVEKENTVCLDDRHDMRESIVKLRVKMAYVTVLYGIGSATLVSLASIGIKYLVQGHL